GLAFLETTANPYILSMGDPATATQRLNLAQAFNPIGSLTGMTVASVFILSNLQIEGFRNDFDAYQIEHGPAVEMQTPHKVLPVFQARESAPIQDPVLGDFMKQHYSAPDAAPLDLPTALGKFQSGEIASFGGASHQELQQNDLKIISTPYMVIGFVVIGVMLLFLFNKLPDTTHADDEREGSPISDILGRLFRNPHYLGGVVAQTFYVGAQIMCWTFIIQYAQDELGMSKATAQNHNIGAMVIFLASRFVCTFFLKFISPGKLLAVLAIGAMAATLGAIHLQGMPGLYSLMAISACMSLMFPTIYGIALHGLGPDAKIGSAGLILAIVGGAFMPRIQGGVLDLDSFLGVSATRGSFYLPFVCFVVIALYGFWARKDRVSRRDMATGVQV
ncbi:MAG: MFS transporter, partial [Luteolibacter sp.]